jgi:hypothetical protein
MLFSFCPGILHLAVFSQGMLSPGPQEGFRQDLLKSKIWTSARIQAQDQTCGKTTDRHGMAVDSTTIKVWS